MPKNEDRHLMGFEMNGNSAIFVSLCKNSFRLCNTTTAASITSQHRVQHPLLAAPRVFSAVRASELVLQLRGLGTKWENMHMAHIQWSPQALPSLREMPREATTVAKWKPLKTRAAYMGCRLQPLLNGFCGLTAC